jgi:hypothetical protein
LSMIKDLKKSGLLSQKVFNDYVKEMKEGKGFTFENLLRTLRTHGVEAEDSTIRMFYESMDCNNSGSIDYPEFIKHFAQSPATNMTKFLLNAFDVYFHASSSIKRNSQDIEAAYMRSPLHSLFHEQQLMEMETILETVEKMIFTTYGIPVPGVLFLTNYRLVFVAYHNATMQADINALGGSKLFTYCEVPVMSVSKVEEEQSKKDVASFVLFCKDFRVLHFSNEKNPSRIAPLLHILRMVAFPDTFEQFAYAFARPFISVSVHRTGIISI